MRIVFDTESDGLKNEATRLWCIAAIDVDTCEEWFFYPGNIESGLRLLEEADEIVAHNCFNHDIPLIKKLYPNWTYKKAYDTFIMSSLYEPDRAGGHSIDSWAKKFGLHKPVHEDWTQFSEDMRVRCQEDTRINLEVFLHLIEKMSGWEKAMELEFSVARVQARQEEKGVLFDVKAARKLYRHLNERLGEIDKRLYEELPERWVRQGANEIKKPFMKNGGLSKAAREWMEGVEDHVSGQFTRVKREPMNLNSHDQIKKYLLSQGWKPTQWNYKKDGKKLVKGSDGKPIKTSPKLSEDSFHTVKGEVPKLIAERSVLLHRRGMIYNVRSNDGELTGWANSIREDGRISAQAIPQATNTGRYRHKTIVNVPKAKDKVPYGKELRSLFIVPQGHTMVGTDAKALENRMEGHYTAFFDGGSYARELLEGDPHLSNAKAFSKALGREVDRDLSKTIKYALLYGAQPPKVADTVDGTLQEGQMLFDAFWDNNPALVRLKTLVDKKLQQNGYLLGLDGRKIRIRNQHSALNALFQCAGSLVVKKATSICFEEYVPREQLDAEIVLHFHDEFQAEVRDSDVTRYVELANQSFEEAGKYFNLNIPIEGDTKTGHNWKETH